MPASDVNNQSTDGAAIQRTVDSLRARNIEAIVVENGEAAKQKLIEMVPPGSEVFKGTSETLDSIGYSDYLQQDARYTNLNDQIAAESDPEK